MSNPYQCPIGVVEKFIQLDGSRERAFQRPWYGGLFQQMDDITHVTVNMPVLMKSNSLVKSGIRSGVFMYVCNFRHKIKIFIMDKR